MEASMTLVYLVSFFAVVIAMAFAVYLHLWVKKQPVENGTIIKVSDLIKTGANTFMRKEYKIFAAFAGVVALILFILLPQPIWKGGNILDNVCMVIAYAAGTVLSAIAGKMGIIVATSSNGRCAEAAQKGIAPSFLVGYRGGAVMGLAVVGFSLFGVAAVLLAFGNTTISNDAYGPIVDNSRGLAEMGGLGEDVIAIADELDSAGNTVKAVTKGFSIGAAGLTVISLLGTYMSEANAALSEAGKALITGFDLLDPIVFFGMLVGAAIPAVFSAMLILGVDKNAQRMVEEIHRQFREIVGLREGKASADYGRCIDIVTSDALRELIPAGLVAILATIAVGFVGGPLAIGGFLMGNIVSGLLLSLFMSNAGGLWDNSKKYVESGHEGGKGSEAHKAAVVGDTVGDPFKDTAGPSINTQITVGLWSHP